MGFQNDPNLMESAREKRGARAPRRPPSQLLMIWIAPSEKDTATTTLEKRLWDAADQFRANSGLKSQEYSPPVLGLIFLRFAEVRYAALRARLLLPSTSGRGAGGEGAARPSRRESRVDDPAAYHAEGTLYLPAEARFDHLLHLPEAQNRTPELQLVNPDLNEDIYDLVEQADLSPEQEEKLERELGKQYYIITRDDRLETVAQDIVRHFLGRGFLGKAMVVSIDKATALRMHDKVRKFWEIERVAVEAEIAELSKYPEGRRSQTAATEDNAARLRELAERLEVIRTTDMAVIDFEALRQRFKDSSHKNTDLEVLKAAIRAQLEKLIRLNKTRADFAQKFEELIESYNTGSRNIEQLSWG